MTMSNKRRHSAMYWDSLEPRRLLSTAAVVNGVLTISGTGGNDTIGVHFDAANNQYVVALDGKATLSEDRATKTFSVAFSGTTQTISADGIYAVSVDGGAGNDEIYLAEQILVVRTSDATGSVASSPPVSLNSGDLPPDAVVVNNADSLAITIPATVRGGDGDDRIVGTAEPDDLRGGPGEDTISGLDGNDTIVGGEGDDYLSGQSGNDLIQGGDGGDTLSGAAGNDTLYGGVGSDELRGGRGGDFLFGEDGNDNLDGGIRDASEILPDMLDGGTGITQIQKR
jgi:Ca2+-binding RTX toxin-like protein